MPDTTAAPVGVGSTDYDRAHAAAHQSDLMRELWSRAMGDQYPAEVDPFSSCSWWLLGRAVAGLCMRPGGLLVDLGCGRGGPGLWLARALSARLIGVDFSATAVALATSRAGDFGLADRAEFRQATFEDTTIADQAADAIVSVDALPFAPDRTAALREAARILRPGGRLVFSGRTARLDAPSWAGMASLAGLDVEASHINREHDEHWQRLYDLWLSHADQLRADVGDAVADNLLREATQGGARLGQREAVVIVMRRPRPIRHHSAPAGGRRIG
jgi:ubiquinone/menaquinone biosynthesis C-methylase UbiE